MTIDLTTKTTIIEPVADAVLAQFYDGKGLATHLLLFCRRFSASPIVFAGLFILVFAKQYAHSTFILALLYLIPVIYILLQIL